MQCKTSQQQQQQLLQREHAIKRGESPYAYGVIIHLFLYEKKRNLIENQWKNITTANLYYC